MLIIFYKFFKIKSLNILIKEFIQNLLIDKFRYLFILLEFNWNSLNEKFVKFSYQSLPKNIKN